jgi:adenylate cyclase
VTTGKPPDSDVEAFWHEFLTRGDSRERAGRRLFKLIPHGPRCRLCAAPFAGAGAQVMRLIDKRPSQGNPTVCNACFKFLSTHHGGAEVEATFLFADVRGSTSLAETMPVSDFHHLMDRFYSTSTQVMFDHDGYVDKFVGDELVAFFFPLLTGERHAARGIEAAQALLHVTGHTDSSGPWVPVGAGVHSGRAWFGAVGEGGRTELTALGDAVNTTARLASVASVGEVLVTAEAAAAAGLDGTLERRTLELKGKQLTTEVVTLRVGPAVAVVD